MSSVHSTHCCVRHGCKYGDEDCPVILGTEKQEYPCENCDPNEDILNGGATASVSIEKLGTMLRIYREKLEQAEMKPIDYASCMRLSAQIGLLEDLYYIAHLNGQQKNR